MLPYLNEGRKQRLTTQEFRGINRNSKTQDGEFFDDLNLSTRAYPCLATRKKRGIVNSMQGITAIGGNSEGLAWVKGDKLYYNGQPVDGITLSTAPEMADKQIISFGAYIIVAPDFVYFNTVDTSDKGTMAASASVSAPIKYTLCRNDGTNYDTTQIIEAPLAPVDPPNGQYWVDTSGIVHMLKMYVESSETWVEIPTTYTKIFAPDVGVNFKAGDGVTISGAGYIGENEKLKEEIATLNGMKVIHATGENYIIVSGIISQVYTQSQGTLMIERKVPKMQHLCVSANRLWGCWYGDKEGKVCNEIYASKLGDFRNFNVFQGLSTDSYAASVGQGGVFTGAVNHLGYPIFFKENCMYKVFGNKPSNYQINDTICAGVQFGSEKSIAIVNHTLVYLSRDGEVVAYDGAYPQSVSAPLAGTKLSKGRAGACGDKYYITARSDSVESVWCLDVRRGIWHKESTMQEIGYFNQGGELFSATASGVICIDGNTGEAESTLEWSATTGLVGWEMADQKYISRFNVRANLASGAGLYLEIEYDSNGVWEPKGGMSAEASRVGTMLFPVRVRRCDHFRLRIRGRGDVMIYSIDRILEGGSDGNAFI